MIEAWQAGRQRYGKLDGGGMASWTTEGWQARWRREGNALTQIAGNAGDREHTFKLCLVCQR
ncbi:hypothetical protein BGX38DRAFT_1234466 [Terfezia claveryi]|nr:hypothetical protein BGX38DRAFT_1234466 [Terfezia claveryi]